MSQGKDKKYWIFGLTLGISFLLYGCSADQPQQSTVEPSENSDQGEPTQVPETSLADVISVEAAGSPNAYQFSIGISSPDQGCEQYADWWEVLSEDGQLVYRRILAHSHVNEQPFIRSGGPVEVGPETVVIVRAHMHPGGYGGKAMKGSIQSGFEAVELMPGFADELEKAPPQPTGCAF